MWGAAASQGARQRTRWGGTVQAKVGGQRGSIYIIVDETSGIQEPQWSFTPTHRVLMETKLPVLTSLAFMNV